VPARTGHRAGAEVVCVLVRELDPRPCQPRPWRPVKTDGDGGHRIPDLISRDFIADAAGEKFVGDVTYIRTGEGWLHLATDCYTKMVVGWSMADHFRTSLIEAALDMAATRIIIAEHAIFHSELHQLRIRQEIEEHEYATVRRPYRRVLG
jgi:transposase InsO family protein